MGNSERKTDPNGVLKNIIDTLASLPQTDMVILIIDDAIEQQ